MGTTTAMLGSSTTSSYHFLLVQTNTNLPLPIDPGGLAAANTCLPVWSCVTSLSEYAGWRNEALICRH